MIGMFSLSVPSGLTLYWIVGNIIGVIQQSFTSKIEWRNIFSLGLSLPSEPEKPSKRKKRDE
jgi:membrane protein insertase Oxa1/YidC/SpoIIIJ